ncbi:hypothetical protein FC92_GL001085 [Liquorilactobacillus hordei DSM 19519]|uniref:Uncharacterized protein n=1 Tax=Liquorilactobacillus hordei DSM 19519 TaxID=1423759 RepID=A0A0R1MJ09_9LACO|nr:hypothetical protein FC92_GL001085 [Liquorilactobacillus hordei DSM 19519]
MTLLEKIDPEIKWGGRLRPTELCNFDMFEENTIFILKDKFLTYGDTEDLSIISELDYTDFVALINIMKE